MTDDRSPARAVASLRGLAVGDAVGACYFIPLNQPLLADRRLPPDPWYWTDDTEMACSVLAVLRDRGHVDQDALAHSFAEHHDFDRGYGAGVNRMLRLIRQEGADWREQAQGMFSGKGSWGNGAAMRVAPLGAWYGSADLDRVVAEATASAEVTHTHPEGVAGAVAVAVAAALAADSDLTGHAFLDEIAERTPPGLVRDGIGNAMTLLPLTDPRSAAASLGNGRYISAPDTVPFCLWVAAKNPNNFQNAFWDTAIVGGDIDTTCAIVGGIVAARVGVAGIPEDWLKRCEALPEWVGLGSGLA
ncbi:ADP-ribosylglycohydrolase family protein [Catenulispora pinisilvae]|uniref:ADP-ribosylglycohydrolase family protein n=1 Tax=Catenulispora pinisilvae TaxID=2705253 RepID=UPI001891BDA2|nr:ADP-ribosylglycohydrolase family protein [Catenulispora pinisilvae]